MLGELVHSPTLSAADNSPQAALALAAAATGLGGLARNFPDDSERARTAAGKAIRRALARVTAADPHIGDHLRRSVRTGVLCSYRPA